MGIYQLFSSRPGAVFVVMSLLVGCLQGSPSWAQEADGEGTAQVVRLLSPPGRTAAGKVKVEALLIDPGIRELVFYVDGEEADRRNKLPWRGEVELADPPRKQTVEVEALGEGGRVLGRDAVELNRVYRPFRVRFANLGGSEGEYLEVSGEVSLPYGGELERVDLYVGETPLSTLRRASFAGRLTHPVRKGDLVKAVARLKDGREVEAVRLFGVENVERAETRLVQLQALVTRRDGRTITGLGREDFRVVEGGEERPLDRVLPAADVALNIGLVVDTSGSMDEIWGSVQRAVQAFLHTVIRPGDRTFLTTFADRVRLAVPLTRNAAEVDRALSQIEPDGLTALYDSIVFSMLQFADEPGRRALVVLTDGLDHGSHTDPDQVVKFGRSLGVPVYVVSLPSSGGRARTAASEAPVHALKLLTDPTGGRLLRMGRGGLDRAFAQIADELRSQYLLTYYTESLDGEEVFPEVRVPGLGKKAEVRSVLAWDQVR